MGRYVKRQLDALYAEGEGEHILNNNLEMIELKDIIERYVGNSDPTDSKETTN
jgi:hypothetical protein